MKKQLADLQSSSKLPSDDIRAVLTTILAELTSDEDQVINAEEF
ncbi:hypothetical protein [Brevundimonas sp. C43]|nr:hypothetical protein [Brevundimonas sp. C43]